MGIIKNETSTANNNKKNLGSFLRLTLISCYYFKNNIRDDASQMNFHNKLELTTIMNFMHVVKISVTHRRKST